MIKNIMINASKVPSVPTISRELWTFGANSGQLGLNDTLARSSPVQVGAVNDWHKIDFGYKYSMAIKTDGTLWAWGSNTVGQLGDGTTTSRSSPVQIGTLTNWKEISAGWNLSPTSMAIKTDGTLWTWGNGASGALGDGTITSKSSPVQVGTRTDWTFVNSGGGWGHAITSAGSLWGWGLGSSGNIGDGTLLAKSSPVQIGTLTNWLKVNASDSHTMAIKTDGTLWGWGFNSDGRLGDLTITSKSSPVQITTLSDWTHITCGGGFNVGVKTDGSLWAWGLGTQGQLGLSLPANRPAQVMPYQDKWRAFFMGGSHTMAIKTDGTLWGWGQNTNGQLGRGSLVSTQSPVQIGTLTTWKTVACGHNHSLMISNDGSLWSTGFNTYGQLGDNTTVRKSSPVQVEPTTKTNWVAVDGGLNFSIALDSSGSIWTWGFAGNGELGDGTTVDKSSPIQVGTLTTWAKITAANGGAYAIKTDGTLWSWGFGVWGALGDGTETAKSSPVQIGTLTNWQKVSGGGYYGLAIRGTDGTGSLWAWGYNGQGQLGDGTTTNRSSPVQIGTLTNWKEISAGHDSGGAAFGTSMAIKTDGTLWAWGYNNDGLLGDETTVSKSSPVQVGTLTTWVSASVGMRVTTAMETTSSQTGSLYTWGANLPALGRIGPTGTSVRSPIQLGTFSTDDYKWSKTEIASGFDFTIALKTAGSSSGSLFVWGQNASGQLGDGTTVAKSSPIQVGALTTWVSASVGSDHAGIIRQY